MAVHGSKILAPFAMDVELDRHALAAVALNCPQDNALPGRLNHLERWRPSGLDLRHGDCMATREVKTGIRMSGILDQYLGVGLVRGLVVISL